jgi:AcrR family transcriptional regulator
MKSNKYSDKEIAVFDGLVGLLKQGRSLYSIKVSEIAKAANIGKGTIYDYFSSKEEAIYLALLYYLNNEMERIVSEVESTPSFKNKIYKLLDITEENIESKYSSLKTILSAKDISSVYDLLEADKKLIDLFISYMGKLLQSIVTSGESEGCINKAYSDYYKKSAIRSILIGFAQFISHKECYEDVDVNLAKEVAYTQLIKMLR